MRPDSRLRGKVAVVTGSTRGIGLLLATFLARAGASITLSGRHLAGVEAAYQSLAAIPGLEVLGWPCDVREPEQVERLAEQSVARFGGLDIWVNCAALASPLAPTAEMPAAAWRSILDTNLLGTVHGTQVALRHMLPRNAGKIINLVDPSVGHAAHATCRAAYAASKVGALHFTQVVAEEYRATALSILAMAPGRVPTDLLAAAQSLTPTAEAALAHARQDLAQAQTDILEAGELVVHLASAATDGITGRLYEVKPPLTTRLRARLRR